MLRLEIVVLFFLLIACNSNTSQESTKEQKVTTEEVTINSICSHGDTLTFTDSGSFNILALSCKEVYFEFSPNCGRSFTTRKINDTLLFFWNSEGDCLYNTGLDTSFLGIRNPKNGDLFGKLFLKNDSILLIDYVFNEWVDRLNAIENAKIDSIFPRYFYKVDLTSYKQPALSEPFPE